MMAITARRTPFVYVLILNWNGKQITIDCVTSVVRSHYPKFSVLVIDNGSTDGSALALRKILGRRINVVENKMNLGYARGFNVGLKYAFEDKNADYCLVMNNDTVIDPKAMSELVKIAETDNMIGFVTGKVYYHDRPNILQTVGKKEDPVRWNGDHIGNREEDRGQYDKICELHFADDIFTLVSKKLYKEAGGYNPMFFLQGEEYDWQARAKRSGYKIMYTPYARLWHKESSTIGKDSARKAYFDARNPMLVILLHRSPEFFRRYFRCHLKDRVFRSSLASLKRLRISHGLARWRGLIAGLVWGLRNKKFSLQHFYGK